MNPKTFDCPIAFSRNIGWIIYQEQDTLKTGVALSMLITMEPNNEGIGNNID